MRTTFAVGRLTPRSAEIVLLDALREPAHIRGPFTLKARVEPIRLRLARRSSRRPPRSSGRIH